MPPPLIGITADADERTYKCARAYCAMVAQAGGVPVILPHRLDRLDEYVRLCGGFVLTGGDDPRLEEFGVPTHPKARPIDPDRQVFEIALLRAVPSAQPVLGICLGMQLMALTAGGSLDQCLPESLPTHEQHWGNKTHLIEGEVGRGTVLSHHRQAVSHPGRLVVVGRAPDGVIEAISDPSCAFRLGVQWHPERTAEGPLGRDLFVELVNGCR